MMQNNKKIGLVTWYGPANYGTGLQAFALKRYLELQGYDVCFIEDRSASAIPNMGHRRKKKIRNLFSISWWRKLRYRKDNIVRDQFQSSYMNEFCQVEIIESVDDINRLNDSIDIFISGGDQIWNPTVTKPYLMLSFVDLNKPKISYGTSVGVKEIPHKLRSEYRQYLSTYKYISVREIQSKEALCGVIDNDIEVVLDPTFLLTVKEWDYLLEEAHIDEIDFKLPYIFCYFVGNRNEYWNYVEKIRRSTGYRVVVLPINDEGYNNEYWKYVKVSPAEFLWLIKNAEIICTDSFHATVFSIQFGKEFYTMKRFVDQEKSSQNGRLYNLLSKYKIQERIVKSEKEFVRLDVIDYDIVWSMIEADRRESKKWLNQVLKEL